MTVKSRRPMDDRPSPRQQAGDLARAKKPAGRPKGEPSTIVNVRLPLTLVAALDRYLDSIGIFIFPVPEVPVTQG